jgi:hypothetical protein
MPQIKVVVVALAGVFFAAVDVAIADAEDKHLIVVSEVNNANNLTSNASTPATSSTPTPPTIGPYVRFATRRVTMPLYVGTGSMKIMSQIQNLCPLHNTPTVLHNRHRWHHWGIGEAFST